MGKRGHGGKKRNKKNKSGNENKGSDNKANAENKGSDNKANAPQKTIIQLDTKIILDKTYKGKLRAVTIKQVDQDIDLKGIAKDIEYLDGKEYSLYAIERLNKKETAEDGSVQILPSTTCKLTFKGDNIPATLKLWYTEVKCNPFWNNVIQCYNCLRYRHLSTTCKGSSRCRKCSSKKDENHKCATDKLTCANCKGEHDAMDNTCPMYAFNKECNLIMATENIDYKTAVKRHKEKKAETKTRDITKDIQDVLNSNMVALTKTVEESLSEKMDELMKKLASLESQISRVSRINQVD